MLPGLTRPTYALIIASWLGLLWAGAVGGCAESASEYPSIGSINDVTKTLSPQERDKALSDLTAEKQKQGQAAK